MNGCPLDAGSEPTSSQQDCSKKLAVANAAAGSEVNAKLSKFGISAVSITPAEFNSYLRKERDRWSKVFRESGIKLD